MKKEDLKTRRLRYRLHYNIRKKGFRLITKERTIYHCAMDPFPENKHLERLVDEFNYVIQLTLTFAFLLFLTGCAPGRMVGTGYLVTVQQGIKTNWDKVETTQEADVFVYKNTGLNFNTDSLLGNHLPFWTFRNGTVEVYVEKKGVYQKKSNKKRWRMYDENY